MSYRQIYYHIIFSTKKRSNSLNEENCKQLYKYIYGIITHRKCKLYRINGVEDRIHILSAFHPSKSLSDFIRDIKTNSSHWMKTSNLFPSFDGWQDSYSAFTCSINDKDKIIEYIKNQKQHHHHESYLEEMARILKENDVFFSDTDFE